MAGLLRPGLPVSPPLLQCQELVVGYSGRGILPPIQVALGQGEFWAVVGRNGSGKTTWFKTVLGLLPPVSGRLSWPGGPVPVAYVPQRSAFDPLYPVPVHDVVAMGAERGWSFLRPRGATREAVGAALEAVGAEALADRTFRSLSEGQKQRVLLARMVASGARLALLDEPTAAMDAVAESEAMELLDRLRVRYCMTVVVVSHHLAAAFRYADRMLFIDPDAGVEVGSPEQIRHSHAYRARYDEARRDLEAHGIHAEPECLDG